MQQQSVDGSMSKRFIFSEFIHKHRATIVHIISALLILLYTYASFSKLVDVKTFTGQMNNQPMPNWMTPYLVLGVPSVEIIIAVMLMFDKTRKLGFLASFLLMSAFTIYVSLAVFHVFSRMPCSCGGVLSKMSWTQHLYFNIFFTLISLWSVYLMKTNRGKSSEQFQPVFT